MRLEQRIRALEAKMITDPVDLHFADGSLIRQSVAAQEPGGGRMVELLRCFLKGPAEERGGTFVRPVAS